MDKAKCSKILYKSDSFVFSRKAGTRALTSVSLFQLVRRPAFLILAETPKREVLRNALLYLRLNRQCERGATT